MMRFNKGKLQFSQLPFRWMKPTVRLFEFGGSVKYLRGNFRIKVESLEALLTDIIDPLLRHLTDLHDAIEELNRGSISEDEFRARIKDPDCFLPYTAHVAWNAIVLQMQLILMGLVEEDPGQAWLQVPGIEDKMKVWAEQRAKAKEERNENRTSC